MTGWVVAAVLAAGLAVAIWENLGLADQNKHLRSTLDGILDRAESAGQAYTIGRLRLVVEQLRERARWTADKSAWHAFHDAAHLVEREHIAPLVEQLEATAEAETAGVSDG